MKGKITAIFTDSARIKAEIETLQPSSFEQIIEDVTPAAATRPAN